MSEWGGIKKLNLNQETKTCATKFNWSPTDKLYTQSLKKSTPFPNPHHLSLTITPAPQVNSVSRLCLKWPSNHRSSPDSETLWKTILASSLNKTSLETRSWNQRYGIFGYEERKLTQWWFANMWCCTSRNIHSLVFSMTACAHSQKRRVVRLVSIAEPFLVLYGSLYHMCEVWQLAEKEPFCPTKNPRTVLYPIIYLHMQF